MKSAVLFLALLGCPFAVLGQTGWQWQNPLPQGNSLYDVEAINNNHAVAVGEVGTIVATYDGGNTWTVRHHAGGIGEDLNGVSFGDEDVGMAVGDDGNILKSTDGGDSWILMGSGTTNDLISVSLVTPTSGWVIDDQGRILHTSDGGETWVAQNSPSIYVRSVWFADTMNGWTAGSRGTILHTTDGGSVWVLQNSGTTRHLNPVFFLDAYTGWAAGDSSTILKTTDGGLTWVDQSMDTFDDILDVRFISEESGFVVRSRFSGGRLFFTTDGGQSWNEYPLDDGTGLVAIDFGGGHSGWTVGSQILHTLDGATWEFQSSGMQESLYSVFFVNPDTGWSVGGTSTVLRTVDGGETWTSQTAPTNQVLNSVSFVDGNTGWAVGYSGIILKTTDSGVTWLQQASGTTASLQGVHFVSPDLGWAVGWSGTILRTTDGGQTWLQQSSGTTNHFEAVHFRSSNAGSVVGQGGAVWGTWDSGANWFAVGTGTCCWLNSVYFTDILNGWAVGEYGVIVRTTNSGGSWVDHSLSTEETLYSISFVDDSTGWIVGAGEIPQTSESIILHTTNAGGAWQTQTSGTSQILRSVHFPDRDHGWIAGNGGTILHSITGGGPAPERVLLLAPGRGAIVGVDSVTFRWRTPPPDADSYRFELAADSLFSTALIDSTLLDTTCVLNNLNESQIYWWRVRGMNSIGWGPLSEVRRFQSTSQIPGTPSPVFPQDGSLAQLPDVAIGWTRVFLTSFYTLQLSEDPTFGTLFEEDSALVDTSYIMTGLLPDTRYFWRVSARNLNGSSVWSETWSFQTSLTGVADEEGIPSTYMLRQNYPNPFNPSTLITYGIPESGRVRLEIFNILGQSVFVLVDGEKEAGFHSVVLRGAGLASGLYFYRLQAGGFTETRKLVLMK